MKLEQVLYIEASNLDDYVIKTQQLIYAKGEFVQSLELYIRFDQ